MDKTRKILLLILSALALTAVLAFFFSIKSEHMVQYRSQRDRYDKGYSELLNRVPKNKEYLEARLLLLKNEESALLEHSDITYADSYEFGSCILKDLKQFGLKVNQYRFLNTEDTPLMEIQVQGSVNRCLDYLYFLSSDHPECFITRLVLTKYKGELRINYRIGYEQGI